MFSRAGSTLTQICGRYSDGMNLLGGDQRLAGDPCKEHAREKGGGAYRALKKKTSHVRMGRKGSRNWRVTGISKPSMTSDAAPVFTIGLGAWLMEREKMPTMISTRYWAS